MWSKAECQGHGQGREGGWILTAPTIEEHLVSDTSCSQTEQEEVGLEGGPPVGIEKPGPGGLFTEPSIMKFIWKVETSQR